MRTEMLQRLHQAGFPDVTYAHIPIFRHAGPDGRQPTEIAAAAQLSKQSVNNQLGQLERAGYLKRKAHPDDGRARIVQLTARGRRLEAAIWQAGRDVEQGWRDQIGERDWRVFRRVLDQIAVADPAGTESEDEG
jgi:DNA-binding MarR family transcriptional regulator